MRPVYSPSSSASPSFRRSALVHRDVAAGVEVRDRRASPRPCASPSCGASSPSSTRRLGAAARYGDASPPRPGAGVTALRCGRALAALADACSTSRSTIRPPGPVPATLVEVDAALARDPARERRRPHARARRSAVRGGPASPCGAPASPPRFSGGGPAARACASGGGAGAVAAGFWRRLGVPAPPRGFGAPCCRRRGRGRFRGRRALAPAPRSRRRRAPTRPPASGSRRAMPSSKASSSMFALSVSTSARMSPMATRSPRCFSQRMMLALLHRVGELRHE